MTKKQLILAFVAMLVISLLVSATTTIGGVWYMNKTLAHSQNGGNGDKASSGFFDSLPFIGGGDDEADDAPSFHQLDQIVLSINDKRQPHFVMLEVALETHRPEKLENVDNYMPVIRHALLKLFADKTFTDLQEPGAVNALQNEVKQTILMALADTRMGRAIDDVLLTKYVVQ